MRLSAPVPPQPAQTPRRRATSPAPQPTPRARRHVLRRARTRFHGPALRTGQPMDRLVYERAEQVTNCNVGKTSLSLSGPGRQHSPRPVTGQVESSLPQRRLADAGISLDDHHPRTRPPLLKQPRHRGELLFPAHDVRRHHPPAPRKMQTPALSSTSPLSSSTRQDATSGTHSDGARAGGPERPAGRTCSARSSAPG